MQALGAPPEDIERVRQRIEAASQPADASFGVHADNRRAVAAFMALATQWQFAGMEGQRTGLHYASVLAWLEFRVSRPATRRALFADLQTMERAVLAYEAEQRARNDQE